MQAGKEKSQNPKILTFLKLGYRRAGTIGIPDFQYDIIQNPVSKYYEF